MGAKGLKRLLLSLISKQNIFHSFKHKTIGIDASVLLHKYFGVQDVVDEFLEERYQTLVKLVIADIQQLTKRDVKVIVVLDGGDLPQKAWARKKRDKDLPGAEDTYVAFLQRFNDNSQKVLQEQGPVLWEAERKRLARRCVSRTPDMTTAVIKGLRHAHIPYQVAPYEADAQLAHLYMVKHIDAALTLDSDLVTYGVKKVIFPCEKSRTHNFKTGEMGVFDFDSCLKAPAVNARLAVSYVSHLLARSLAHLFV